MGVLWAVVVVGFVSLLVAYILAKWISKKSSDQKMDEIGTSVREGAFAFLLREFKAIGVFTAIIFLALVFGLDNPDTAGLNEGVLTGIAYAAGAIGSMFAIYFALKSVTQANAKSAQGAAKSLDEALRIGFAGTSVMGLCAAALGIVGLSILIGLYGSFMDAQTVYSVLAGFCLGASSIALFVRVGGGIYSTAAHHCADQKNITGKELQTEIPENPAVVLGLIGDTADAAGAGADLNESYVGSIFAALLIGYPIFANVSKSALLFPLLLAGAGILGSIIGMQFVRTKEGKNVQTAFKRGLWIAYAIVILSSLLLTTLVLPTTYTESMRGVHHSYSQFGVFFSILAGLLAGIVISSLTEYYTSADFIPVKQIVKNVKAQSAPFSGIALGYGNTFWSVITLGAVVLASYRYAGLYGIAIAAVGMLSTLGIRLAIDTYGSVTTTANCIAEAKGLPPNARKRTAALDSAGNKMVVVGRGFSVGSAALTALALFVLYTSAGASSINLINPSVVVGLFIGAMLPFVFCGLIKKATGETVGVMAEEISRHLKKTPKLPKGRTDYRQSVDIDNSADRSTLGAIVKLDNRVRNGKLNNAIIDISTQSALPTMIILGVIVIVTPLTIGIGFGKQGVFVLGGLLAGCIVSGVVLAMTTASASGASNTAKKYLESTHGSYGKEANASVTSQIRELFADPSGPSLNILIKMMTIAALVFVPLLLRIG